MTSWITRRPDRLDDDRAQQLKQILARCPELDRTAEHVRAFAELMNNRQGRHLLCQWIERVQADDLHGFVNGLPPGLCRARHSSSHGKPEILHAGHTAGHAAPEEGARLHKHALDVAHVTFAATRSILPP
ncbi:hypothetical protein [Streptomyces sp. NPDC058632]|uniref:hypothetical protein n=1 Tax=unclassified Streptomyces TaxID=2593676 RepID=UPI00364C812C